MDLRLGLRLQEVEHGAHGPCAHLDRQLPRLHLVDPRFPITTAEILIEDALVLEPPDGRGERCIALRTQHEGHHDEPVSTRLDDRVSYAGYDLSASIRGAVGAIITREGRVAVDSGVARRPQQGSDHGGLHRRVEVLAETGSFALVDRRDGISGRLNGTVIGRLRKPDRQRWAITITLVVQESARSRQGHVRRRRIGQWTGGTERSDADVDQAGVCVGDIIDADAPGGPLGGGRRLEQDVGTRQQTVQRVDAVRGLKIEHDTALAATPHPPVKARAVGVACAAVSRCTPGRRFDLDHLGPEISENAARRLTEIIGQVDDTKVGEQGAHQRCASTSRPGPSSRSSHTDRPQAARMIAAAGPRTSGPVP